MDVRELLGKVKTRAVDVEDAQKVLRSLPYEDLGYAKLDHYRKFRLGFGGTMSCQGKPGAYLLEIYRRFYERDGEVLGIKATGEQFKLVQSAVPEAVYDPISRILKVERPGKERKGLTAVCTGGTADVPVTEEAAQTAEYFGCAVDRAFDVGMVGIRRPLSQWDRIMKANRIIAVAGMEGTLSTVIAGPVNCPVIAVPISVGYGASLHDLSALLIVLNSCVNGIPVINIDNGYRVGYLATQINRSTVR